MRITFGVCLASGFKAENGVESIVITDHRLDDLLVPLPQMGERSTANKHKVTLVR